MSLNNIKTKANERGFTIVELLIVIVVIAILAAITIVAYNGVTARANSTSAQATASTFGKKAEAYNAEIGYYPDAREDLNAAAQSSKSFYLPGGTYAGTDITAAPATPQTIYVERCGAAVPVTGSSVTGVSIQYWKYDGTPAVQTLTYGTTTACEAMPATQA